MAKKHRKKDEAVNNAQINSNTLSNENITEYIIENITDETNIQEEISTVPVFSGDMEFNSEFDLFAGKLKNVVFTQRINRSREKTNKERTSLSPESIEKYVNDSKNGKNNIKNNKRKNINNRRNNNINNINNKNDKNNIKKDGRKNVKRYKNKSKLNNKNEKNLSENNVVPINEKSKALKNVFILNSKMRNYFIAFIAVIFIITLVWIIFHKNASQIYVNDKFIGTVKEKNITSDKIYNDAVAKLQTEKGVNVKIKEEITVKPIHASKSEAATFDYVLAEVCKNLTYQVEASLITIDGNQIAIAANEDTANKLLDDFAAKYVPDGSNIIEKSFVENVNIEKKFVESGEIETNETIINKLSSTKNQPKDHTVASGDTLSNISSRANMTVDELINANPGLSKNSVLNLGQTLKLLVPVPILSVRTVEQTKYTENFSADEVVVENKEEDKSYEKVITEGKEGQREVTVNVTRLNGVEEDESIVETKTLVEPVAKKVERGTIQTSS